MSLDYTAEYLVEGIKLEGSVPSEQRLFDTPDFIRLMSDTLKKRITPRILATREEHFVHYEDIALESGKLRYRVPKRAIGGKVRGVAIYDANGRKIKDLDRLQPENNEQVVGDPSIRSGSTYHFENSHVILAEDLDSQATTLRIKYYRRPNRLVENNEAGQITAINYDTGSITLSNLPSTFKAGVKVDIIAGTPGFESRADSLTIEGQIAFSIQVDETKVQEVEIGDWVALEGCSPIPQIPEDLHAILQQHAVVKVLTSLEDTQGAANAAADLDELERNLYELLEDRDDQSDTKLVNTGNAWNQLDDDYEVY